jgi:hypothetical protein
MKKYTFTAMTASFLLYSGHTLAMQQPAVNKSSGQLIKLFAKKTLSGSMTGLHWTIAAGVPVHTGLARANILLNEKKTFSELTNADENTTQFIMTSREKTCNKKIDAVKIDPEYTLLGAPMTTWNKHIIISPSTAHEITEALKADDQIILNKWRGTLEHEGNHIKNNDFWWRTAADLTLPFVTHGSIKVIRNALPIAKKTSSFLGEQLIKIPTAIGKAHITNITRMAICRLQEQRADDEISSDVNALNGMKELLKEAEQKNVELLKELNPSPFLQWRSSFYDMHPSNTLRIEKIDQRIALLEKQSHDSNNS